jgi:hypothetical protein
MMAIARFIKTKIQEYRIRPQCQCKKSLSALSTIAETKSLQT